MKNFLVFAVVAIVFASCAVPTEVVTVPAIDSVAVDSVTVGSVTATALVK